MAAKRHLRISAFFLLAVLLVCPPLTGVLADGLGIDLAHHHCASHADADGHADEDHNDAKSDPYQCDQCHVALTALAVESTGLPGAAAITPVAQPATALVPVRAPPVNKPPIV